MNMIGKLDTSKHRKVRIKGKEFLLNKLSPKLKGLKPSRKLKPKKPLKLKIIHKCHHQNRDRDLKRKHIRCPHKFKKKKPLC